MPMRTFLLIAVLLFGLVRLSDATLVNGDFSNGLTGWTTMGNVATPGGVAVMSDNDAPYSLLYQGSQSAQGLFKIDFDFKGELSSVAAHGAFPDTFFASLYFTDDLAKFDQNRDFEDSLDLFDLDHTGTSNVNGDISDSAKGQDWSHFSLTFQNDFQYIIPTFELFNLNFLNNDSQVLLDNIQLELIPPVPVPEPATLTLAGVGLLALACLRHKPRRRSGSAA